MRIFSKLFFSFLLLGGLSFLLPTDTYAANPQCCYESVVAETPLGGSETFLDKPQGKSCEIITTASTCTEGTKQITAPGPFPYFQTVKTEKIDCFTNAYCLSEVDKKEFVISRIIPSGGKDPTKLTPEDTLDFSIKVVNGSNQTWQQPITLECLNCSGTPGISSSNASNFNLKQALPYEMNFSLNIPEYVKRKTVTGNDPHKFKLQFLAYYDLGVVASMTYQDFEFTILPLDCSTKPKNSCNSEFCLWSDSINKCISKADQKNCNLLKQTECEVSNACTWQNNACVTNQKASIDAYISSTYGGRPDGYEGPLPDCAFSGECRDVNDLIDLVLRAINYVFSIIAAIAFVFFIYGGFTWIFSFGSSDKIKKGQQILVAAVVGLVIVFSAYILVDFLLDVLNVSDSFRGIGN